MFLEPGEGALELTQQRFGSRSVVAKRFLPRDKLTLTFDGAATFLHMAFGHGPAALSHRGRLSRLGPSVTERGHFGKSPAFRLASPQKSSNRPVNSKLRAKACQR